MHYEESSAEVEEALGRVRIWEVDLKHIDQLFFSILFVYHGSVDFDAVETVIESLLAVTLNHVRLEFYKVARRNVDHFLSIFVIGHVALSEAATVLSV